MKFTDTHCHLYSEEFKSDIDSVIDRAMAEGVNKFYMPGIDSHAINDMLLLEEKFKGKCIAMMGLHPCYVKENYKDELLIVEQWLSKRKFAAVGEIGLDFYWDTSFTTQQYDAFRQQIELSLHHQLPIVIHTRNAMQETIDVVKEYVSKGVRGIFHCFGGTYTEAMDIIDCGFYLGIGGVLTYKKSGLEEVLKKIDCKHIVLETDAPYLSPVPYRGKRNESSYIKIIAQKIADLKGMDLEEVAGITNLNVQKIFGD